ncbi:MAG: hypothetical protein K9N09_07170 [Candidatus Cloacimonetes bacterium]|nr:hypothetical protein [Candidatus Cloacimonadota bacterium]MCF7814259.1 hypothetical protein [Candidatus Cloacimonadota bacterium]MCF7868466.1 hypothetical protein [Candidatus Cloacimonadota bacterium]MCF7883914.1 hypothetical protein [Candidatus Cloacimonadota bacterium]
MKNWIYLVLLASLLIFGCDGSTDPEGGEEIINVTFPTGTTIWLEFQTNTYCEWENATGANVYIEIYKGETLVGIYHIETENTGHVDRTEALGDWGTGTNFRLKVIDSDENFGWSEYFVIQEQTTGEINVTYPNASTVWQEFATNTYCEWDNATGATVNIAVYKGTIFKGFYVDETNNDGYYSREVANGDWGSGSDFRLKVTDSNNNFGWSGFFTIQAAANPDIEVTTPNSSTVWQEFQTNTIVEWANAPGETLDIEVYQGDTYKGLYADDINNDGYYSRELALDDWGTGTNMKLKLIDSDGNSGWSDEFTIQTASTPDIIVTTPNSSTIWQEFQTNTFVEWSNAQGLTLDIEVYQGNNFKGMYAEEINNDGYYSRELALGDWGSGTNMKLKFIASGRNTGWSDEFTIEAVTPGQIDVLYPDGTTVWTEYQFNTECDWSGAVGDSIFIEIFKADVYVDMYHNWTANDGHCSQNDALGDWGTGSDFQLKVIDAEGNFGFSDYFTIQALTDPITIIYPDNSTIWQQFEVDTYCDWINASGPTVYIEIYKGGTYLDLYHEETDNDGHCVHNGPLPDWGSGDDYQLKIIDAEGNSDFSDFFTIE